MTIKEQRAENRRQRVVKGLLEMKVTMSPRDYLPYALLSKSDQEKVYSQWAKESVGLD